tara:strand:+ start:1410 stop:2066 length:657 start_codon:yes stop_codon:yes gene_type:complete
MLKKLFRIKQVQSFLSWLISIYLKICFHTSIWKVKNLHNLQKILKNEKSCIVCFWHGRLLMTPFCWNNKKKFSMLISGHPDGVLISKAVSYFGIKTIVGSSFKNKFSSFKNIIKEINSNNIIGITPDGPRGPKRKVKEGLISLAKLTQVPIIPLAYGSRFGKRLNSWDKFLFIFPFNKIVAVWGNPIHIKKNNDLKKEMKNLENELNRITNLADNLSN